MKRLCIFFSIIFCAVNLFGQEIGKMAPEKDPITFPPNAFGVDIIFNEAGFGLGTFYRRELNEKFTFFTDFSISEETDNREFTFVDVFGRTFTLGKKNRVYMLPLNFGLQYRLFASSLSDNLRPYISFGTGPAMVLTTPADLEFFKSFGKAQAHYTMGGYIGLGANFGIDKSNLVGLNIRYYLIHFFNEGVESLEGEFLKNLGGIFLTINIGFMY